MIVYVFYVKTVDKENNMLFAAEPITLSRPEQALSATILLHVIIVK